MNSFYQATDEHPVYLTAADFANNGGFEVIPSLFLPDKAGHLKEFPANGRDDVIERMPVLKKKFNNYKSFAVATMDSIIPPDKRANSTRLHANVLQSCYIRNEGGGRFTLIPLPKEAQVSILNGMVADDFDGDGNADVLISGNDFGTDVSIGRYDALNGLLLKGDGSGAFKPLSIRQSGIYIPGNGKAFVKLAGSKDNYLAAASQHNDVLKLFELKRRVRIIKVNADDQLGMIHFSNGKIQKEEFYYGSSFLSQSGRFIQIGNNVSFVEITNNSGNKRKISFDK